MELISIKEIDNVQSVSSPHDQELKKFGNKWVSRFRDFENKDLEKISRLIGGVVDSLGINEDWALTKNFYPEVRFHLSYHYHGEEFSDFGEEDALRFLFSGERVRNVTGEDLTGMVDVTLNFIGRSLMGIVFEGNQDKLRNKYFESREKAIRYLDTSCREDMVELSNFLGGQYNKIDSKHVLVKEFFPELKVKVELGDDLRAFCAGDRTASFTDHELDLLAVYTLNHIIRFIALKYSDQNLPEMCRKVFPQ